ncbi:Pyruvate, water dikinase [Mycolicibacterium rhodesiae JS60]|nr:Pyruvate, water dikinase [Mycolicibacterium rhodesiae JS60]
MTYPITDKPAGALTLVLPLTACTTGNAHLVGGKALGLGELAAAGFDVPEGFAVTTQAYRRAVSVSGCRDRITELLENLPEDSAGQESTSARLRELFVADMIDDSLREVISTSYEAMGCPPVAVRSSAVAEDRPDASFAGQQDTYLWVETTESVVDRILSCWASLFSTRVLTYRKRLALSPEEIAMAVVVQRMVPARSAGVLMTLDPVTGNRETIYLESSYGLGEAVVAGEVTPDGFWIGKDDLTIHRSSVGTKQIAHRFDATAGKVVRTDVDVERQGQFSLSNREAEQLARLGRDVESAFGYTVDIEWAIDEKTDTIALLQARPETVWSSRPTPQQEPVASVLAAPSVTDCVTELPVESWDPLHSPTDDHTHWSTSNVAEAMPGVMTPLSWSLWHRVLEKASLNAAFQIGVLSRREAKPASDVNRQWFRAFYGRPALQVRYMAMIGDRMPGTSGEQAVESVLGRVPDDWQSEPTLRRLPIIALRLPWVTVSGPRKIRRTAEAVDEWYPKHLKRVSSATTVTEAVRLFEDAAAQFDRAVSMQVLSALGVVIPVYSALERLIELRGKGDLAKLSGFGGAEVAGLVTDVWRASRGEISLDDVVASIGFHGPSEGEMSSTVWREDSAPLRDLIEAYSRQDDSVDPRRKDAEHRVAARASAAELLAATPTWQRPAVKALIALAARRIPLRGVVKRSLLQALDGARAAARQIGELRTGAGQFQDPTDVFYLTENEISSMPADTDVLIKRRRERRAMYEAVAVPHSWQGTPSAEPLGGCDPHPEASGKAVEGIGVSAGLVEGFARVLHTPDFSQVEPGDILVTPTTDPSWSSVMLLSSGLVVDIGGALSHAAIVARELGVPCVVNTRNGTTAIRTGDRLRVNGGTGVVEIIDAAPDADQLAPAEGKARTVNGHEQAPTLESKGLS